MSSISEVTSHPLRDTPNSNATTSRFDWPGHTAMSIDIPQDEKRQSNDGVSTYNDVCVETKD